MSEPQQPILEARGLAKRYGQVVALDGVDFELYPDEIVAVIGDNGAGKSTLIKALSGALQPDEGEIRLDGKRVRFRTPGDARSAGIETVYQDLAVAPSLDIASNIFLGREARRRGPLGLALRMLAKRSMRREAARRRTGGVGLQGPVHTFMAAVLLRVTGLDELRQDAEADPPGRERGEGGWRLRGSEGQAVVRAYRFGQPVAGEELLERLPASA